MTLGYDHALEPVLAGTTLAWHVRDARDAAGDLIDFTGWDVRIIAQRWLQEGIPPLIDGGTSAIRGLGAVDVTLDPPATATLLNGLPTNDILLYWKIRAAKSNAVVILDAGTLPVVRSIESAA